MADPPVRDTFLESRMESDAGAAKGKWWHAGFHLTTAINSDAALRVQGIGVLEHCEKAGRRHIRFRELAADVLGYFVSTCYREDGKRTADLLRCSVPSFYSVAVSGYWLFGNKSNSNILKSLMPDEGPALAPTAVLGLAVIFVLLQLLAIGLVYSQVAYEIMEKQSSDVKQGKFSKRNLIPRIILRSLYVMFCGFMAAMLPFFGEISGVVGAMGFIPLDFILPMLLYNMTFKPSRSTITYWLNFSIIFVFTGVGIMGTFSSIRKLILDANQFKLFSSDVVVD
ncbi:putative GABA transporter 2 [Hibiscus syriacus]|uniref:GABA transporter 2 n=1 Tax=Hibiscus syriacus TaxID=106335 RepID=A0A6A2YC78_HIBSY|nr:putative GABA transporter 2 [Hibiscus syriacus]